LKLGELVMWGKILARKSLYNTFEIVIKLEIGR